MINTTQQQPSETPTQSTTQQPGSMLRRMLSNSTQRAANHQQQEVVTDSAGNRYMRINNLQYRVSNKSSKPTKTKAKQHKSTEQSGSLVDGGANGGLRGGDSRVLEIVEGVKVDVGGVADSQVTDLEICQAAGIVDTIGDGPIIVIMSQYADYGVGDTIHSAAQLRKFGAIVDDTARSCGGRQCIITAEGYVIPLHIRDGLARMDMRPPNDIEMEHYPHVFLTADSPWDPSCIDDEYEDTFHAPIMGDPEVEKRREERDPRADDFGFMRTREGYWTRVEASEPVEEEQVLYDTMATAIDIIDPNGETIPREQPSLLERAANDMLQLFPNKLRKKFPHMDALKPYFGWVSNERIKKCLDKTTQHYRGVVHYPFRKHFKSRFPGANVHRLREWMAMDTFFSDTPAGDDGVPGHAGCTMLHVFLGLTSSYLFGHPMRSEKQIPEAMEECIRKVGAPIGIMSDQAKAEMHGRAKDLLRMYEIDDRQSEAHYQHQNPMERHIQDLKRTTNNIMDRVGCPSKWWLLATTFVITLFNHLPNVKGEIPAEVISGCLQDVSKFMHFHFWQEVFVESHKKGKREELAWWVFPALNVGDELTYWVLLHDTEELVARSNVRAAKDPLYPNLRERPKTDDLGIKKFAPVETDMTDESGEKSESGPLYNLQDQFDVPIHLPRFSPDELLGLTYLHDTADGQRVRAKIVKKIMDQDAANHERIKMLVSYDDGKIEEIMSYNQLCDLVAEQHDQEPADGSLFKFREISDHSDPLKPSDPMYMGSTYNVKVLWEDGTSTWEPLGEMIACDPATMAAYAKEHDLLETPGWKKLKKFARRDKVLKRMLNASKRAQRFGEVVYKFGVRIPRSVKEAIQLDKENGNTLWQDAMEKEIGQINEYKVYRSLGQGAEVPPGYQLIPVRMVFDVKQTLQRKARLVARGDKTTPPADAVYSGVASLRSLRIVCFLAELNGLKLTGGDVGNAYLEAYTKEKVCFRAGPEFGELEGQILVIDKALYGLRTSGARFHAKFADTLRSLGFTPSYADPDVWLRDAGDCYEYVVVYVDDILTALKDPDPFYKALKSDPWKYKLKNVEEPRYHLGGDFFRDRDGTFCYGAQTYVKRMLDNYKMLFNELPPESKAPMEKGDQPELDDSPLLGPDGTQKYQSLIGALQWTISLSRLDVNHAVMSLGRFRAAPREGHLERLKKLCGYFRKRPHGAIRFRTEIPKHEEIFGYEPVRYEWMESVYGCPSEPISESFPEPKGKTVRSTSFCDANLMHDTVTGRSASGCMEMLNQTPIDWMAKRQPQVETATYGSEFMVARQAVERIQDLRYTLRSFGVPLEKEAWLFGDNKSVVTSSTIPHSALSKRWNALSYHKVREAIAGGWVRFEHMPGTENPADIFTKPLPWATMKHFVEPLMFWKGETYDDAQSTPEGSIIIQGTSLSSELPQGDGGALKEAEVRTGSARASQPACIGQDGSHLTVTSIQYEISSTGWLP